MSNYTLSEWAGRPFSGTWTSIGKGNLADPQAAMQGATDLFCYDRNAGAGAIFATVREGRLDNGTIVQNGPVQVGGTIAFDRRWNQIVEGPFGKSGAQLLFYDATTGVGEFFGLAANGSLRLIKQNTGWRTSWTQILSGKFSADDGVQLLFYDASAGTGEFYSVDSAGSLHLIRSITTWRNSWNTILAGKFSDNKFNDLLFYDRAAGTGEFWQTDGRGGMKLFSSHTNWRTTWRGVKAGYFDPASKYSGLLFYEDGTGYTEFYGTNGRASITQLNVDLGNVWPSKAARWQSVLVGNFTGGSSDIVGYDPSGRAISYFRVLQHA